MARRRGSRRPVLGVARQDRPGRVFPCRLRQRVPRLERLLQPRCVREARLWHLSAGSFERSERRYTIFNDGDSQPQNIDDKMHLWRPSQTRPTTETTSVSLLVMAMLYHMLRVSA